MLLYWIKIGKNLYKRAIYFPTWNIAENITALRKRYRQMAVEKAEAIVIKTFESGESSQRIRLLCRQKGKITVFAKPSFACLSAFYIRRIYAL